MYLYNFIWEGVIQYMKSVQFLSFIFSITVISV